ncbi:MAG: hypothetical protein IJU37_11795 [Desulfovibrio sp.]|nr:hypothetical protein [Desulfovibrio sp.]
MSVTNLETICARYGHTIAEAPGLQKPSEKENVITKALGVLAENGFYALNVFLLSCKDAKYGEAVENILCEMLCDKELALLSNKAQGVKALQGMREITADLPRLILARRVTEQALTFARYHCKALGKSEK